MSITKHTMGGMRTAVKVSDQYNAWELDDLHNRTHTFRPERLKIIATIVDQETSVPTLQSRIDSLEAENTLLKAQKAEMVEALRAIEDTAVFLSDAVTIVRTVIAKAETVGTDNPQTRSE